jgi:tetratricopeptide (TPR) repeat protein
MAIAGPIAERAARDALRADREDPWAHHALGHVHLAARRFDESLAEFEMAVRLNPSFSLAQGYYGLTLSLCGRWEEGSLAASRALRLNPRGPFSAIYKCAASYAQFVGCNYDEAIRLAHEAIRLHGGWCFGYRALTAAAGMAGQGAVAAAALRGLRRAQPAVSLDWVATHLPIKRDIERDHLLDGCRRAGLN